MKSQSKMKTLSIRHFSRYKSLGAFGCHWNQSFDPICPKTLCSLSPTPLMLHVKFIKIGQMASRDIQVWKCGQRQMNGGPLLNYKLTLCAFGSGELIIIKNSSHPKYMTEADYMKRWCRTEVQMNTCENKYFYRFLTMNSTVSPGCLIYFWKFLS